MFLSRAVCLGVFGPPSAETIRNAPATAAPNRPSIIVDLEMVNPDSDDSSVGGWAGADGVSLMLTKVVSV